jgi:K+-transporting ATPase ATPase B chain
VVRLGQQSSRPGDRSTRIYSARSQGRGQQRLLNGIITLILFFTVLFANFAEAIAEGRGKAQADALRSTRSDTIARKITATARSQSVSSMA